MRRMRACAILAALLSAAAGARVGRGPVMFEDPTVVWKGVWEARFEGIYAADARVAGLEQNLLKFPLRLAYGWRDRTEVALEVPYLFHDAPRRNADESGLSDVTLEIKYQMTGDPSEEASSSASLVFGHGPSDAVGTDGFLFGIRYRLGRRLLRGEGVLEVGYTLFGGEPDDRFNWAIGYVDHLGTRGFRYSIEAVGNAGISPRFAGDVYLLAGVAYPVTPTWEVRAAAGGGVSKDAGTALVRLGLTKSFGKHARAQFEERSVRWEPEPPPTAAEFVAEGDAALAKGDYAAAEAAYRKAVEADPGEASAWNNLGVALYSEGRIAEARDAFAKALSLGKEEADVYFNLGLAEYRLGRIPEARRAFTKALEKDPKHALARQNLDALAPPGRRDDGR